MKDYILIDFCIVTKFNSNHCVHRTETDMKIGFQEKLTEKSSVKVRV